MRRYRTHFAIAFILTFMLAGLSWASPAEPFKTRLDNGLTVIIEEEHAAPVVSVQMWVRVGGADETDKEAGISHVFEHMLFKGTEKRKVGQIANMIESVGGDINAYTSFDNTVYYTTVPSRHFATGLDIISDAIQHSSFDPDELKKELEVVLEEIRMNDDSPSRNIYKNLLATSYTAHPYKRPVIGFKETVNTFTREQILKFFKKWYIPNNMTLVIVGDVNKDAALKAVKESFKDFKKAPDPHKKRPVEPAQEGFRTKLITQPVKEARFGMGFHIPDAKSGDTYAIDVMSVILGGGHSSRLYKKLKIEQALVHDISSYPMSLKDPGIFLITGSLESKNADKAVYAALREITRLRTEGPSHDELEKAKINLESDFVYQRETMQGIADKLGYFETMFKDLDYEKKYLEGIRKVTTDDIKKTIGKYLNASNLTAAVLVPSAEKNAVTTDTLAASIKKASEEAKAEIKEEREKPEKITKVRLDNGMTLIVKEVHSNPTVAFYAAFPGGLRYENAKTNGLSSFLSSMLTRGTAKRSREELSKEMEEMAGGVGGFSGWNTMGASGKFLSKFFDKGLAIFADIVMNPTFPEDEIEKLRKDTIAAIIRQEDYLPGYTFKLLYKELFRTHPYGMPSIGTEETVKYFNRDDLQRHYEDFFVPERTVMTIVGDVNTDQAIERVNALFKNFTRPAGKLPVPAQDEPLAGVRTTGDVKQKAQTNTGIGFRGATIKDEDRYALKVMNEVLSGQSGRLFLELRDKQSLAYSVSSFSREGVDPGLIGFYIASAPDKKDAGIRGIFSELEKLTKKKITDDELNRAKRSIIGGYEIGLQEVSGQASDMANNELFSFGYGFSKEFPKKIDAVTAEDVLRVARKYLTLDSYVISVVGPNGTAPEKK